MTTDRTAFTEAMEDLGALFANLSSPSSRTLAIWFRHFGETPDDVLSAAVDRLIRDHRDHRVAPAHLHAYVDEVSRDRNRALPEPEPELCSDPACTSCGGTGTYTRALEFGGVRHDMPLICRSNHDR